MTDELFDLEELNLDQAVRDEYAKSPALTPFSRTPMAYDLAAKHGARSAAIAQRRIIFGPLAAASRKPLEGI